MNPRASLKEFKRSLRENKTKNKQTGLIVVGWSCNPKRILESNFVFRLSYCYQSCLDDYGCTILYLTRKFLLASLQRKKKV